MVKLSFKGGLHISGKKELTNHLPSLPAIIPQKVYIPLWQNVGEPCYPKVAIGEHVKIGQKIGDVKGPLGAAIHASISGQVVAVEKRPLSTGKLVSCIVIENDQKEEWVELQPHHNPEELSSEKIIEIIREAGLVGLGGGAFPTYFKYQKPDQKRVDLVILNGAECEPYITADHRTMLEKPQQVIDGLRYLMKCVQSPQGIIAIEENKPDAIRILEEYAAKHSNIKVVILKEKYPQGSEKYLIYACTKKEIPPGGLPIDLGIIVSNVSTAVAVTDALEKGLPLIERVVTVSGDGVKRPANYRVRIGTLFKDIVAEIGGYSQDSKKLIAGGPMMGTAMYTDEFPVIKGNSGITVLIEKPPRLFKQNCVRCGKCVDVCPVFLEPTTIVRSIKKERWEEEITKSCLYCIECGSCSYICPACIPLVDYIRFGKQIIMQNMKKKS